MKFEVGFVTILNTAGAGSQLMAIRAPTTEVCQLRELGLFPDSAANTKVGLARATTVSTSPTGNIAAQNLVPGGPASGTVIVTGWSVAPVISTTYLSEFSMIPTSGAGVILTWPADRPLLVGTGAAVSEIVLVNLLVTTCPLYRGYAVFED